MSLLTSMFNAVSSMKNSSTSMDVISNNIANMDTVGYKTQRVTFADTLSQTLKYASAGSSDAGGTNAIQIGLGAQISSVSSLFNQGTLETTDNYSDLAIDGEGFFVVKVNGSDYYTRDGQFTIDSSGNLVSSASSGILQGYLATNGVVNQSSGLVNLTIPLSDKSEAKQTSEIEFTGNLQSSSEKEIDDPAAIDITYLNYADSSTSTQSTLSSMTEGDTVTAGDYTYTYGTDFTTFEQLFAKINADVSTFSAEYNGSDGTYTLSDSSGTITSVTSSNTDLNTVLNSSTSLGVTKTLFCPASLTTNVSVFDSQGTTHILKVTYTQTDTNTWTWSAVTDITTTDTTTNPPTSTTIPTSVGNGEITFNSDGSYKSSTNQSITFPTSNGSTSSIEINFNFGESGSLLGLTQVDSSMTLTTSQDGYASGDLSSISIDQYGQIIGSYSNGQSKTLGQIALATFRNNNGLVKEGDSLYSSTINSGDAMINILNEGSATEIVSGSLESSTVDLTQEFAKMIITQRAYQASAKLITTSDDMISDLIALKR
jgi:flagellar hook protein FlgE